MFKTLTAFALAISLSLAGGQARAQQFDGQQAAQVLGGLLAIYGISQAIKDRRDRDEARHVQAHQPRYHYPNVPSWQRGGNHVPHGRPAFRGTRHALNACTVAYRGRGGPQVGYGLACLERRIAQHALPPRGCLRQVYTRYGRDWVYSRPCLAQAGWVGRR